MSRAFSELVEIILVTYNRAKDLDETLERLRQSPLANCKFTVIDNASTDTTPEVCAKHAASFPRFNVKRNRFNVGISGNFLRALETASSEYTWILCDDDDYDFSHFDDVEQAVTSGKFDLVCVGVPNHSELPKGTEIRAQDLIRNPSANFFYTTSFIPCTIFRTKLITPEMVLRGYYTIHTIYSNVFFYVYAVKQNAMVYVSKYDFIIMRQENVGYRPLHLVAGWLMVANMVKKDDRACAQAMLHEFLGGPFYPRKIAQFTMLQRGFVSGSSAHDGFRIAKESLRAGPTWFLKVLPFLGLMLMPAFVSRWLWRQAEKHVERSQGRKIKRPGNIEFGEGKAYRG